MHEKYRLMDHEYNEEVHTCDERKDAVAAETPLYGRFLIGAAVSSSETLAIKAPLCCCPLGAKCLDRDVTLPKRDGQDEGIGSWRARQQQGHIRC